MNFDFPDELRQLRDEARRFLTERCPTAVTRRILEGPEPYDRTLWQAMAEMGWTGAAIPEEYGGAGLGHLAVCVLAEELGHAVAPVPFASSVYLASEAIQLYGSDAQKRQYLPKLAAGELIGTLAMAERPGPVDPARLTAHITDGRLSGTKLAVPDGDVADFAIVALRGDRGPCLAIVDLAGPGVTREPVTTIDPTRSHARIVFDGAPAEPLPGGDGADAVRHLLDRAAVMLAFEQVGCAQAALEMARDYARERYAFGRPIGSFQAIKHKLADIYIAVELARSNAYYGAWALSPMPPSCRSRPRSRASRPATRVARFEGEHPDAWRHGLHLADGLSVLLSPGEAARAGAGWRARVEAAADRRTAQAQHGSAADGLTDCERRRSRRTSKTPRTRPPSAPRPAPSWRPTPSAASQARWKAPPRPGRAGRHGPRQGVPAQEGRGRACRDPLAEGLGRPRRHADPERDPQPGGAQFHVLSGIFGIGIQLAMPTICVCGTPEQRERFVPPRCAPTTCGASSSPNPPAAPTWPGCARAPCATAATGSSTARRSGPRARITAISASWWRAAIPSAEARRASPTSSST